MKSSRLASAFFTFLLALLLVGVTSFEAEARRLGGGKSFGRQSSNVTQRQATPPAAPAQPANAAAAAGAKGAAAGAARKPWAGMLGGLAAGLGLAWLANALGLGAEFANLLLIGLLVLAGLAVVRMLRRPRAGGAMAYQGAGASVGDSLLPRQYNPTKVGNDASARPWEAQGAAFDGGGSLIGSALQGAQGWGIPAGFDVVGFTEAAKRNFVSLQKAWDQGDIPTLRAMMTDEMLGEIQAQLAERERDAPGQANETEVMVLDAQLLGIEELDDLYMASVEFSGMMREDVSAGPNPFREVWNMTKPRSSRGGWLVAGVQSLQ
ncbi:MAG TPA: Tim44-like domain-containing protein [Ottowia sp.]|uniref:Tim44 domain-containing protein n=1 Tax=Ottowia sp. TaxID=1898956 RepID=UPI002C0C1A08|nr:Tim44-like domain-containing protein [Ottowia sp.]HMN20290.1 Tim44-like domain-containing protein [Ottowia sp.]